MISLQKENAYRSRKFLDLAKGQACVMCRSDDGTVVSAHSNLLEHGKGRGQKAEDSMCAWLCYACHTDYDQGNKMSREEKRDFILTAICRTYMEIMKKGFLYIK